MGKSATLKPRRVKNAEDRNAGRSGFVTLKKTGDQFVGYALFKPDPELDDNPGYYEYFEHYTPATGYCPCSGDECPLCAEGDNPSTRAKTLWYIDGEIKVFTLNYYMIQEFVDLYGEDEPVFGQQFRIKRLEGQGKYAIRPKTEKMKATDLKKVMKEVEDDQLEKIAIKQMKRVFEELDVEDAMTEDDEDEKEEKKSKGDKSSKSSKKSKEKDEEPEDETSFDPEDDDEAIDLAVTVVKAKKKDNVLVVTAGDSPEFEVYGTDDVDVSNFKKGDELIVSFEKDSDDDFVLSEAEEKPEEAEEGKKTDDDEDEVEDLEMTITSINTDDETINVEAEDGPSFELFFLSDGEDDNGKDWSDLDLDDYEEGQVVLVTAKKDDDGDMLASKFPEPVKKGKSSKGKSKSTKKKK